MATPTDQQIAEIQSLVDAPETNANPPRESNRDCTQGERVLHYGFNAVVAIAGLFAIAVLFRLGSRRELVGLGATATILAVWWIFRERRIRPTIYVRRRQ